MPSGQLRCAASLPFWFLRHTVPVHLHECLALTLAHVQVLSDVLERLACKVLRAGRKIFSQNAFQRLEGFASACKRIPALVSVSSCSHRFYVFQVGACQKNPLALLLSTRIITMFDSDRRLMDERVGS